MYDLIDKELKNYYICGHKYMFLISLCVSIIFIILSIFYSEALIFIVIFATISVVFFATWNNNKKMYGNKLLYTNDVITIKNHKNLTIKEFKLESLKKKYIPIAFNVYPRFSYKCCLVLYFNFEPYENMEYCSYCNDSNIVIIQNPELIDRINKLIDF